MPDDGAEQLKALGKRLKQCDKELTKRLRKKLRDAVKPMKGKVKEAALRDLPTRGGLSRRVARSSIGARSTLTGRNAGVRLVAKNSSIDIKTIDQGIVRHPVYGRGAWVEQSVTPGFWSETLASPLLAGVVRSAVRDAVDEIGRMATDG